LKTDRTDDKKGIVMTKVKRATYNMDWKWQRGNNQLINKSKIF